MKFYPFPPSVKNEARVIDYLNWSCQKINAANHYDFLKKMRDASYSGFGMLVFFITWSNINSGVALTLFILSISFAFYVIIYCYHCMAIMDAFHMNHLDNITEQDLLAFQKKR